MRTYRAGTIATTFAAVLLMVPTTAATASTATAGTETAGTTGRTGAGTAANTGTGMGTGTAAGRGTGAEQAEGSFVATVDFGSLQAAEVRGNKCEFTVDGVLSFSGDVVGDAVGTTTAVIFAPCADALASPPGTYFDVFRFEGSFSGDVLGVPTDGTLSYAGVTRVGGGIDATVILDGDRARAVLRADAQVAVGGTYAGAAKPS